MRLLVHSLWQCNHDGCNGFPLKLDVCDGVELEERRKARSKPDLAASQIIPQDFDAQLVMAMLEKIVDYDVFVQTARDLDLVVPPERPSSKDDDTAMQQLHAALFEYHIIEGVLTCPICAYQYPISNGIPDFVQSS